MLDGARDWVCGVDEQFSGAMETPELREERWGKASRARGPELPIGCKEKFALRRCFKEPGEELADALRMLGRELKE